MHLISKSASARERKRALLGYFSKAPCYWNKWFAAAAAAARFFSESRLLFFATQLFVLYFLFSHSGRLFICFRRRRPENVWKYAPSKKYFLLPVTHTHTHTQSPERTSERTRKLLAAICFRAMREQLWNDLLASWFARSTAGLLDCNSPMTAFCGRLLPSQNKVIGSTTSTVPSFQHWGPPS